MKMDELRSQIAELRARIVELSEKDDITADENTEPDACLEAHEARTAEFTSPPTRTPNWTRALRPMRPAPPSSTRLRPVRPASPLPVSGSWSVPPGLTPRRS